MPFKITKPANKKNKICFYSLKTRFTCVVYGEGREARSIMCENSFVFHYFFLFLNSYHRVQCQFIHVIHNYMNIPMSELLIQEKEK